MTNKLPLISLCGCVTLYLIEVQVATGAINLAVGCGVKGVSYDVRRVYS